MSVRVEAIGAQGNPPALMAFAVTLDGEHLERLLWSAGRMPLGERSVQKHLRQALEVLLGVTGTGGEPDSLEGSSTDAGSSGSGAPTPSAPLSSEAEAVTG